MSNLHNLGIVVVASTILSISNLINPVYASVVDVDHFAIYKNGSLYWEDNFNDGNPPPSYGTPLPLDGPISISKSGDFTEANGRAQMGASDSLGLPFLPNSVLSSGTTTFAGETLARSHRIRLNSNSSNNPADLGSGLKTDDDIIVMGLFDLTTPDSPSTNYGIGFSDFGFGSPGALNGTYRMRVIQGASDINVSFSKLNFAVSPNVITPIAFTPADFDNQQILLRLRTDGAANSESNTIFAEYAYVNGAVDLSAGPNPAGVNFTPLGTAEGFADELFVRAEMTFLQRVEQLNFGALTAGSPTSISQEVGVDTGISEISVMFNYRFETTTGNFSVFLDDEQVGSTILAPAVFSSAFRSIILTLDDITTINALEGTLVDLKFIIDGDPGSKILIDSIVVDGLSGFQGGSFDSESLEQFWTVTLDSSSSSGRGAAEIAIVASTIPVPEPSSIALFAIGLAGLVGLRRRRLPIGSTP